MCKYGKEEKSLVKALGYRDCSIGEGVARAPCNPIVPFPIIDTPSTQLHQLYAHHGFLSAGGILSCMSESVLSALSAFRVVQEGLREGQGSGSVIA